MIKNNFNLVHNQMEQPLVQLEIEFNNLELFKTIMEMKINIAANNYKNNILILIMEQENKIKGLLIQ